MNKIDYYFELKRIYRHYWQLNAGAGRLAPIALTAFIFFIGGIVLTLALKHLPLVWFPAIFALCVVTVIPTALIIPLIYILEITDQQVKIRERSLIRHFDDDIKLLK